MGLPSIQDIVDEEGVVNGEGIEEKLRLEEGVGREKKEVKMSDSEETEVEGLRKQLEILQKNQTLMMRQIEVMNTQMSKIIELSMK